jgi:hypothetical protein
MFGRGICEKYQSRDEIGSGNFSSLDWYFSQIPLPNMIYLYKNLTKALPSYLPEYLVVSCLRYSKMDRRLKLSRR